MKRTTAAAFLLILTSTIGPAGLADEPQRYLVATKRPFRAGVLASIVRDARNGVAPRDVAALETFRGFAATLTSSEVAAMRRASDVRWIEPIVERHATAETRNLEGQTITYGVSMIHAREAQTGIRRNAVNVAVLDTGVDYRHDELKDVWAGGTNVFDPAKTPLDDAGHGTHVSGIITAADNAMGVLGVAPNIRLWGVKVLNSTGTGTQETVIKGIDWVVAKKKEIGGNWVINMSLGSSRASAAEREAVSRAIDAGIIIAAASGNESTAATPAPVGYPAGYDNVLAVGAVDETANIATFSNQGPELDIAAPGVRVLSTVPVGTSYLSTISHNGRRFEADPLDGSATGRLAGDFVYCGLGNPGDFPASVRGKIALIKRGELTFAKKARNAVDAGAVGVIVYNNVNGTPNWTLRSNDDPWSFEYQFPIVVGVTMADGEALQQQASGALNIAIDPDDYAVFSGTSMATPHVAGAAALIWSMAPDATAADVRNALTATAVDLGAPGQDNIYGAGLVDVLNAAKRLAPFSFPTRPTTGRIPGKR